MLKCSHSPSVQAHWGAGPLKTFNVQHWCRSGMKLPPPHGITTQTLPLHIGVAELMQSADAVHVAMTATVATMVLPVIGTPKDVAIGSATGPVDTHVPPYFPLETARFMCVSMPRSEGRHNSQMVRSVAKLGEGPKALSMSSPLHSESTVCRNLVGPCCEIGSRNDVVVELPSVRLARGFRPRLTARIRRVAVFRKPDSGLRTIPPSSRR